MIIVAERQNLPLYCGKLADELVAFKNKNDLDTAYISEVSGIRASHLSSVFRNCIQCTNVRPLNAQRLSALIHIRKSIGMSTKIKTSDGNKVLDISLPATVTMMRDALVEYIKNYEGTYRSLERQADLCRGFVTLAAKNPNRFLTISQILHIYSCWIEELHFPDQAY